jgi:hypothetical protein
MSAFSVVGGKFRENHVTRHCLQSNTLTPLLNATVASWKQDWLGLDERALRFTMMAIHDNYLRRRRRYVVAPPHTTIYGPPS